MADIRIHKHFTDYTLNTDNPGRQLFFYSVMAELQKQPFAVFKIGVDMPGIGSAYYGVKNGIVNLCLGHGAATLEDNVITFKDDVTFGMFVHEASHFFHMTVDRGLCKSPALFQKGVLIPEEKAAAHIQSLSSEVERLMSPLIRDLEYEAGWRAMYSDKKYKMFPGTRMMLEMQIGNLVMYDLTHQSDEWKAKLNEQLGGDNSKFLNWFHENSLPLYKKYSEWEDPNHIIKGVL